MIKELLRSGYSKISCTEDQCAFSAVISTKLEVYIIHKLFSVDRHAIINQDQSEGEHYICKDKTDSQENFDSSQLFMKVKVKVRNSVHRFSEHSCINVYF